MVQTHASHTRYPAPYATLIPAYFQRYPNPLATHVLSVDVLERRLVWRPCAAAAEVASAVSSSSSSSSQLVLCTTRLILKRGTLPAWAPRGIVKNSESWVLEQSEVELDAPAGSGGDDGQRDAQGRRMRVWTRNLDHTHKLAVTEGLELAEGSARGATSSASASNSESAHAHLTPPDATAALSRGHITSNISVLGRRIEKFGLKRFIAHADTSREGILLVHAALLSHQPGTLSSTPAQKPRRQRLAAALRPPFLDGDVPGPIMRARARLEQLRAWWRDLGRAGAVGLRAGEEGEKARPGEWLRARLVGMREKREAEAAQTQ